MTGKEIPYNINSGGVLPVRGLYILKPFVTAPLDRVENHLFVGRTGAVSFLFNERIFLDQDEPAHPLNVAHAALMLASLAYYKKLSPGVYVPGSNNKA